MPCSPFADAQGSFLHCKKNHQLSMYVHTYNKGCLCFATPFFAEYKPFVC